MIREERGPRSSKDHYPGVKPKERKAILVMSEDCICIWRIGDDPNAQGSAGRAQAQSPSLGN